MYDESDQLSHEDTAPALAVPGTRLVILLGSPLLVLQLNIVLLHVAIDISSLVRQLFVKTLDQFS